MNLLTASEPVETEASPGSVQSEVISLEAVSVRYRIPQERIATFKEYIIRWLQRRVKLRTIQALEGVDLQIYKGEVFGLIGHNGAGKSTLLKLVAQVLKPTTGRVVVKGRVAPLLAIGAGFHPELTGRENIFLNGALLGFSQHEMENKYEGIVDFAELRNFIDAPMRTYSSGMWARLGFAVATDVEPDILIIDEVLAVGDESFQRKSAERMRTFQQRGTTILLVSHNMTVIESMCHRAAWLDHGRIGFTGNAEEAVDAYRKSLNP